jgi:hypothetical protein
VPTATIFIRHSSDSGICWEQCAPPPSPKKGAASYSVGKRGRPTAFDEGKCHDALDEFEGPLTRQNEKKAADKMAVTTRTPPAGVEISPDQVTYELADKNDKSR